MIITDKVYLVKLTDEYGKIINYSFCYDANEVASFLTSQTNKSISTYSYIRIPTEEHASLEEIINQTNYNISIETYKPHYGNELYFLKIYILIEIDGKIQTINYIENFIDLDSTEYFSNLRFKQLLYDTCGRHLTNVQIEDIVENNILDYEISGLVFHGNRIKFDNAEEMKEYYVNNIFNVEKKDIYDFLLSMIRYDERYYNIHGDFTTSRNKHQLLGDNSYGYIVLPLFSLETAEDLYINKDELI